MYNPANAVHIIGVVHWELHEIKNFSNFKNINMVCQIHFTFYDFLKINKTYSYFLLLPLNFFYLFKSRIFYVIATIVNVIHLFFE